jgi:hypothetical protein
MTALTLSLIGVLVAVTALIYTVTKDRRDRRRLITGQRRRGHFVSNTSWNCKIRIVNAGRVPMRSEDLRRPIRIAVPTGRLDVAIIELHQGKNQPTVRLQPTTAELTFIELNDVTLNPGDYLEFQLIITDCNHMPEVSMQAAGFRFQMLEDVTE